MKLPGTAVSVLFLLLSSRAAVGQLATVTTLDAPGDVGQHASLAMGSDQRGLISYYDASGGDLKVAHCADEACTSATTTTLDSAGDVGRYTAIAVGQDGLGIISYVDVTNAALKVAHCSNLSCTAASVATLDGGAASLDGQGTDIAIGNDGRPLIVYQANGTFRVLRCATAHCASATGTTYAWLQGMNPTVTATAGLPLIAANHTIANGAVIVSFGRCLDAGCARADFQIVDPPGIDPDGNPAIKYSYDASLTRGPDGRGVLVHTRETGSVAIRLYYGMLRRCLDDACSAFTEPVPFGSGFRRFFTADVAVGPSDLPWLVAMGRPESPTAPYLGVTTCTAPLCAGSAPDIVDGPGAGAYPSIAVGANGHALVAYYATATKDLKVAYVNGTPVADLVVQALDSPDPVAASGELMYRMWATNAGPNVAHGVVGTFVVPPGTIFTRAEGCVFDTSSRTATCAGPDVAVNLAPLPFGTVVVTVPPGLTGPLTGTASLASATTEPVPGNNVSILTTSTTPGLRITHPPVVEGDSGLRDAGIAVELVPDGGTPPASVTVDYQTTSTFSQAQPGVDYLPASGTLTFTPASPASQAVAVGVVGDTTPEPNERFALRLTNAQGARPVADEEDTTIVDDDGQAGARTALTHGASFTDPLLPAGPLAPSALYRLDVPGESSMEVVVDAASGDVLPLTLDILSASGNVLYSGQATGTGNSVSVRFENPNAPPFLNWSARVRSGGCAANCGPDDLFRIRAYDTTGRIARFNNQGSQTTVLILHNPSSSLVKPDVRFYDADGTLIWSVNYQIPAHATAVIDTRVFAASRAGSITVAHDAPYGVLQGKAVAIEPATGLAFDTPLTYRPR